MTQRNLGASGRGRMDAGEGGSLALPSSAQIPIHKRDIVNIVKSMKSNVKNLTLSREYLLTLHAKIFEDVGPQSPVTAGNNPLSPKTSTAPKRRGSNKESASPTVPPSDKDGGSAFSTSPVNTTAAGGKAAFNKFILNSTGGIATVLATIDHHATDVPYQEVALVFLHNIMYYGGKRNGRVITKVVKKNGSRTLLAVVNKNPTSVRVVHPACMCIIAVASVDSKISTLARLTGANGNLLQLIKTHQSSMTIDATGGILSALKSLTKGDLNVAHAGKKGAVALMMDLMVKWMNRGPAAGPILKWASKMVLALCAQDDCQTEFFKEGGVNLVITILYEQSQSVDTQRCCLDLLQVAMRNPDGVAQFQQAGGVPFIVNLVFENNQDKKTQEDIVELVNQMYKFHGETELPIGKDHDLVWVNPHRAGKGKQSIGDEDDDDPLMSGASTPVPETGLEPISGPPPVKGVDLTPELKGGDIALEAQLPECTVIHHVKPFTDVRPSPSCPSSIDFIPPLEELLMQTQRQQIDFTLNEFRRFLNPRRLLRKVVYDDLERNTALPNSLLAKMQVQAEQQAQQHLLAQQQGSQIPSPPPQNKSSSATAGGAVAGARGGATSSVGNSSIPPLKFGSNFESGNLKRAIQIFDDEYDLILHTDVNTSTFVQWFYFSVENMNPDTTYKFNIINMEKPSSTFNAGQRPLLFSEKRFTWSGFGWLRTGHNITYVKNAYRRKVTKRKKTIGGSYYTVTYSIRFPHGEDRCYLSNCYPYTYSDMMGHLKRLDTKPCAADSLIISKLCDSESGNAVPLVTITNLKRNGVLCDESEIKERQVCVVSARVHPGESNASYMAKGLMDYLLEATDAAEYLRENFVWKIIPMLNVDGVTNGNHRCCLQGRDLNREFISPTRIDHPTIYYLKHLIRHMRMEEGRNVMLYGDFHGHSRRTNFFAYACGSSVKRQVHGVTVERVFPKVLSELAPYFSYDGSDYKVQRSKRNTGRVVVNKELGVRMSFTIEGSMMGGDGCDFIPISYDEQDEETARKMALSRMTSGHFNTGHYSTMGAMFAKAAMLFHQAANEGTGRVCTLVSELIIDARAGTKHHGRSGTASPLPGGLKSPITAGASTSFAGANAAMGQPGTPDDTEQSSGSMSGAYVTGRRGSFRRRRLGSPTTKVVVPAASAQEIADVLKAAMKQRACQGKGANGGKGGKGGNGDGAGDDDDDLDLEDDEGNNSDDDRDEDEDGDGTGDDDLLGGDDDEDDIDD